MLERLNFLIAYVGSAALVAFVAVCLSSPRIYAFECHTAGANGSEQCEVSAAQVAVAPEAGDWSSAALDSPILASRPEVPAASAQSAATASH